MRLNDPCAAAIGELRKDGSTVRCWSGACTAGGLLLGDAVRDVCALRRHLPRGAAAAVRAAAADIVVPVQPPTTCTRAYLTNHATSGRRTSRRPLYQYSRRRVQWPRSVRRISGTTRPHFTSAQPRLKSWRGPRVGVNTDPPPVSFSVPTPSPAYCSTAVLPTPFLAPFLSPPYIQLGSLWKVSTVPSEKC